MEQQKTQKIFRKQPILCPWITSQPYHSSLMNKNRSPTQVDPTLANRFLNNPWINRPAPLGVGRSQDKTLPSIQQSSSQFFYFVRLMQLFPDTHPATLHTVLTLCKNDFFSAVDKLLYAKRCKILCYKRSLAQKLTPNRGKTNGMPESCPKNLHAGNNETIGQASTSKMKNQNVETTNNNKYNENVEKNIQDMQADGDKTQENFGSELSDSIIINVYQDSVEDLSTEK